MTDSYPCSSLDDGEEETKGFLDRNFSRHQGRHGERCHHFSRTLWLLTTVNVAMLLMSTSLFSIWYYTEYWCINPRLRRTSTFSPLLDLLDLDMRAKKVNGTLFPSAIGASIARQLPNSKADALWEEWELTRVYPATRADIVAMGKDPSTVAKLENSYWGLGNDAYVTTLDVFHQIHCLNSLRKFAYGAHYNHSHLNARNESMREIHLNHCVDILMQALQCSGNVNLITMHWVETQEYPFPDMSVNRQCVDFEKLTAWRKTNTIDMDKYVEVMKKPHGVEQLRMPDGYYAYYQMKNPNHIDGGHPGEDFNL